MKFFEFFGMPGAGKTYTIRNLKKDSLDLSIMNKFFAFDKIISKTFLKYWFLNVMGELDE